MPYQPQWSAAKRQFQRDANGRFSRNGLKKFSKGADLGPALKKFDKAKTFEDKQKAIVPVLKAVTKYRLMFRDLKADPEISNGGTVVVREFERTFEALWKSIEHEVQPPKPSGRAEKVVLVAKQNAAEGLRPQWLEVGAIDVTSYLVVDELVAKMERDNELGASWINLQAKCQKIVADSSAAFRETISKIDESLKIVSEADREAKVKEANEVLKHYAKIVEANLNQEVDKYWAGIVSRKRHLKDFKTECATDIAVSTVTIAASTVSIAMSFGAAAISILAIAKAIADMAVVMNKLSRDADGVEQVLVPHMVQIYALHQQRLAAKAKDEGQKLSKTGQAAKEGAAMLLGQISASIMTTASRTQKEAKEFYGKLSNVEAEGAKMYKQIQELTDTFDSDPASGDAHTDKAMAEAHFKFRILNDEYQVFNGVLQGKIAYAEWALDVCGKVRGEDALPSFLKEKGTLAATAGGVLSAGRVFLKAAGVPVP